MHLMGKGGKGGNTEDNSGRGLWLWTLDFGLWGTANGTLPPTTTTTDSV
jgi:hypothetical protein